VLHGWTYKGDSGWHSQLVFRLDTDNAFAAGRWDQAQRLDRRCLLDHQLAALRFHHQGISGCVPCK
jgi:hypothetical protein